MDGHLRRARYSGRCSGCGSRISKGDQVVWRRRHVLCRGCWASDVRVACPMCLTEMTPYEETLFRNGTRVCRRCADVYDDGEALAEEIIAERSANETACPIDERNTRV